MNNKDFDYTHIYRVITDNHTKSTDFVPPDRFENSLYYQKVNEKIKSKNTKSNKNSSGDGCYIATCVYGSYDCPEVWTLRRFRDNTLAKSVFGRAFIRTYYAVSPAIVKVFGNTKWFRTMWKKPLDKMVSGLHEKGVENTPYEDQKW